ncbi:isoprenyl transferase [Kiritimatiellota bacterium B12222]|nr:isoprenyl transferase [Kiritimatiellota bacterium B12222]
MSAQSASIPRHIAVIMDGNGRWAKQRGLPRIKGHEAGAESVKVLMKSAREAGVEIVTLYAFSVENWTRPQDEVSGLMNLLPRMLSKHEKILHQNETRLRAIGRLDQLPPKTRKELDRVMAATEHYTTRQLVLALSYGGRAEITDAMKSIAEKVKSGELSPEDIEDQTISDHLYAADLPDPDLMIRTSGEHRLSNFLLWQLSYAEFYFAPEFWPDFREEAFGKALTEYGRRQRRFGGVNAC